MSRLVTADDIIALSPCWLRDRPDGESRIRILVGAGVTHLQIAEAEDITSADRRWLLTRLAASTAVGRRELVLWAAGCAQDVRHLIRHEEDRDIADAAIATAVAWTQGDATAEDCRDAAYAAYAYAAYAAAAAALVNLALTLDAMEVASGGSAYGVTIRIDLVGATPST